jgi:hypothetical protein
MEEESKNVVAKIMHTPDTNPKLTVTILPYFDACGNNSLYDTCAITPPTQQSIEFKIFSIENMVDDEDEEEEKDDDESGVPIDDSVPWEIPNTKRSTKTPIKAPSGSVNPDNAAIPKANLRFFVAANNGKDTTYPSAKLCNQIAAANKFPKVTDFSIPTPIKIPSGKL